MRRGGLQEEGEKAVRGRAFFSRQGGEAGPGCPEAGKTEGNKARANESQRQRSCCGEKGGPAVAQKPGTRCLSSRLQGSPRGMKGGEESRSRDNPLFYSIDIRPFRGQRCSAGNGQYRSEASYPPLRRASPRKKRAKRERRRRRGVPMAKKVRRNDETMRARSVIRFRRIRRRERWSGKSAE